MTQSNNTSRIQKRPKPLNPDTRESSRFSSTFRRYRFSWLAHTVTVTELFCSVCNFALPIAKYGADQSNTKFHRFCGVYTSKLLTYLIIVSLNLFTFKDHHYITNFEQNLLFVLISQNTSAPCAMCVTSPHIITSSLYVKSSVLQNIDSDPAS